VTADPETIMTPGQCVFHAMQKLWSYVAASVSRKALFISSLRTVSTRGFSSQVESLEKTLEEESV